MRLRPAGFRILIKVEPIDETHQGTSIIMVNDEIKREHGGRDIGTVIEFGPICYKGYADCDNPQDWQANLKVGSKVEFNRYDGKTPRAAEFDKTLLNYRLINDEDIIAVLEE